MGLYTFLTGERHLHGGERPLGEVNGYRHDLGSWHHHPDLHQYVVDSFADGTDDGRPIELTEERLHEVLTAIAEGWLHDEDAVPSDEDREHDRRVFEHALAWVRVETPGESRSVWYRGGW